jgi:hypothetical protein
MNQASSSHRIACGEIFEQRYCVVIDHVANGLSNKNKFLCQLERSGTTGLILRWAMSVCCCFHPLSSLFGFYAFRTPGNQSNGCGRAAATSYCDDCATTPTIDRLITAVQPASASRTTTQKLILYVFVRFTFACGRSATSSMRCGCGNRSQSGTTTSLSNETV